MGCLTTNIVKIDGEGKSTFSRIKEQVEVEVSQVCTIGTSVFEFLLCSDKGPIKDTNDNYFLVKKNVI